MRSPEVRGAERPWLSQVLFVVEVGLSHMPRLEALRDTPLWLDSPYYSLLSYLVSIYARLD